MSTQLVPSYDGKFDEVIDVALWQVNRPKRIAAAEAADVASAIADDKAKEQDTIIEQAEQSGNQRYSRDARRLGGYYHAEASQAHTTAANAWTNVSDARLGDDPSAEETAIRSHIIAAQTHAEQATELSPYDFHKDRAIGSLNTLNSERRRRGRPAVASGQDQIVSTYLTQAGKDTLTKARGSIGQAEYVRQAIQEKIERDGGRWPE